MSENSWSGKSHSTRSSLAAAPSLASPAKKERMTGSSSGMSSSMKCPLPSSLPRVCVCASVGCIVVSSHLVWGKAERRLQASRTSPVELRVKAVGNVLLLPQGQERVIWEKHGLRGVEHGRGVSARE
jgi:hypothetical protein